MIYAKGEADAATYQVRHSGKRLEVAALDLSGTLDEILGARRLPGGNGQGSGYGSGTKRRQQVDISMPRISGSITSGASGREATNQAAFR